MTMPANTHLILGVVAIIVGVLTWFGVLHIAPHHATGLVETTLGILAIL